MAKELPFEPTLFQCAISPFERHFPYSITMLIEFELIDKTTSFCEKNPFSSLVLMIKLAFFGIE